MDVTLLPVTLLLLTGISAFSEPDVSGIWGEWARINDYCSRSCGGGVLYEFRTCISGNCQGDKKRYFSCNTQMCPSNSSDYRTVQCSQHTTESTTSLKPHYNASDECVLTCVAKETGQVHRFSHNVVDGTRCNEFSPNICIDGKCHVTGCDGILGSERRLDNCAVCGGNNTTCYRLVRKYRLKHHVKGYNGIFTIPAGATNIKITKNSHKGQYLALKSENGSYYLNGNWRPESSKRLAAVGTIFTYSSDVTMSGIKKEEVLTGGGPIIEPLAVLLLYTMVGSGDTVHYRYFMPLHTGTSATTATSSPPTQYSPVAQSSTQTQPSKSYIEPYNHDGVVKSGDESLRYETEPAEDGYRVEVGEYVWRPGAWRRCSKACGGGSQRRHVSCFNTRVDSVVKQHRCSSFNKPRHKRQCNTKRCETFRWHAEEWSACSRSCGSGLKMRTVHCTLTTGDGHTSTIRDTACVRVSGVRPDSVKKCNHGVPCLPQKLSCEDTQYGCCIDGITAASGPEQLNCPQADRDEQICFLPPVMGRCRAKLRRWYFDIKTKKCQIFHYGGCNGNENRFATAEACEAKCDGSDGGGTVDTCDQSRSEELCTDYSVQWYYDSAKAWCDRFWYGGCTDSGNHFETEEQCLSTCKERKPAEVTPVTTQMPVTTVKPRTIKVNACDQSRSEELCTEYSVQWYYNLAEARCDRFWYGGCIDSGNYFETEDQCLHACKEGKPIEVTPVTTQMPITTPVLVTTPMQTTTPMPAQSQPTKDRCSMVYARGQCGDSEYRVLWYYNSQERRCERFWYGGCDDDKAVSNRFESRAECQEACLQTQQPDHDRVTEASYRNEVIDTSEETDGHDIIITDEIDQSGDGPETQEHTEKPDIEKDKKRTVTPGIEEDKKHTVTPDIEADIEPIYVTDECTLPAKQELCTQWSVRWRYDLEERRCRRLWWGGCDMEGNTFDTQGLCEARCANRQPVVTTARPRLRTTTREPEPTTPIYLDVCEMPRSEKLCDKWTLRWHYYADHDRCEKFWHGGCDLDGANAFDTVAACEWRCVTKRHSCSMVYARGQCGDSEYRVLWYYNSQERQCERFWYGGCDDDKAVSNRFESRAECQEACLQAQQPDHDRVTEASYRNEVIDTSEETDGHDIIITDEIDQSGDGPETQEHTEKPDIEKDKKRTVTPGIEEDKKHAVTPDIEEDIERVYITDECTLPAKQELCTQWSVRWRYDLEERRCRRWWWGGCDMEGNAFDAQGLCEARCATRQPVVTTGKRVATPRPRLRTTTREPEPTTPIYLDVCEMPRSEKLCDKWTLRWHYYADHDRCEKFWHGGCDLDGANAFDTVAACEWRCVTKRRGGSHTTSRPYDRHKYVTVSVAREVEPTTQSRHAATTTQSRHAATTTQKQDTIGRRDPCHDTRDDNVCDEWIVQWYYNSTDHRCDRFWYGQCGGSGNVFETAEVCQDQCIERVYQDRGVTSVVIADDVDKTDDEMDVDGERERRKDSENVCLELIDNRFCEDWVTMWRYNASLSECVRFWFGQCEGTRNVFGTHEECLQQCDQRETAHQPTSDSHPDVVDKEQTETSDSENVCLELIDNRFCEDWVTMWRYNASLSECVRFWFGQCEGTRNVFGTHEECLQQCDQRETAHQPTSDSHPDVVDKEQTETSDQCLPPRDSRMCEDPVVKWYYSQELGHCDRFWYGGCEEGGNVFDSEDDCKERCSPIAEVITTTVRTLVIITTPVMLTTAPPVTLTTPYYDYAMTAVVSDRCHMAINSAFCSEWVVRWGYNHTRGECERFWSGSCDSEHANKFSSQDECQSTCQMPATTEQDQTDNPLIVFDICDEQVDVGNCKELLVQWYFDAYTMRCQTFHYSGCGGNANRFSSEDRCERICLKRKHGPVDEIIPDRAVDDDNFVREVTNLHPQAVQSNALCAQSVFGCCPDGHTPAYDMQYSNCPSSVPQILPFTQSHFTVKAGLDIIIHCERVGVPRPTVIWYLDGVRLPRYTDKYEQAGDGTLLIHDARFDDSGDYRCATENGQGGIPSQSLRLDIQGTPEILATPSVIFARPHTIAFIHCLATGTPTPTVSWLRESGEVMVDSDRVSVHDNGTLIIQDLQPWDAGVYICRAQSGFSETVNKKLKLVLREPIAVEFLEHNSIYEAGARMALQCKVNGYPPPTVTWYRDNDKLSEDHRIRFDEPGGLIIYNTEVKDSGLYTCKAQNEKGEKDKAATVIRITPAAMIEEKGDCHDAPGAKCRIVVAAQLCQFRMFSKACCQSCTDVSKNL